MQTKWHGLTFLLIGSCSTPARCQTPAAQLPSSLSNEGTPSLQLSNGAPDAGSIARHSESAKASSAAESSVASGGSSTDSSQVVSALSSPAPFTNFSSSSNNSISSIISIAVTSTSSARDSLQGTDGSSKAPQQTQTSSVPLLSRGTSSLANLTRTWESTSSFQTREITPSSLQSTQQSGSLTSSVSNTTGNFEHSSSTFGPILITTRDSAPILGHTSTNPGLQSPSTQPNSKSQPISTSPDPKTSHAETGPRSSHADAAPKNSSGPGQAPEPKPTNPAPKGSPEPKGSPKPGPDPKPKPTNPDPKAKGSPASKPDPDPKAKPTNPSPKGSTPKPDPKNSPTRATPDPDPEKTPTEAAPKASGGPKSKPPETTDPQPTPKASNTVHPSHPSARSSSECQTVTATSKVVSCSTVATVISSTSGVKETCTTSTSTFRGCSADATTRTTTASFAYPSVHECSPSRQAKIRKGSPASKNTSQPDNSIVKRVFSNPQGYPNTSPQAWGAWMNQEARKLTTHIVPHGDRLDIPLGKSESTSEVHELKDSVLSASIIDLNGCTSVVVASSRGVFLSHIYETPSMKPSLDWAGTWIRYPNGLFGPEVAIENTFETDVQEALKEGAPDMLRPDNHMPVMYGIEALTLNNEPTAFLSTDPRFGDNDIKAFIITPRPSHWDPFQGRSVRDPEPPGPARADLADLDAASVGHVEWIKGYLSHKFPQHPVEVIAYDKRVLPPPPANQAIGKILFQYDPFAELRPITVPNLDGSTTQCNTHIAKWRLLVMESQHEYSMNWIAHADQLTDGMTHFPRSKSDQKLPLCPRNGPKGHSTTSKTVTARTQTTAMPRVTSCSMSVVSSHKLTVSIATAPGKYSTSVDSLPETTECACNNGVRAGLSTTTDILGATTWYCAINITGTSTPFIISTKAPASTLSKVPSSTTSATSKATCSVKYTESSTNGLEFTDGRIVINNQNKAVFEKKFSSPDGNIEQNLLDIIASMESTGLQNDVRVTTTSTSDGSLEMNPLYVVYGSLSMNSIADKDTSKLPYCEVTAKSALASGAENVRETRCVFAC